MTSVGDVIEAFRSGPPGYWEAYPLLFRLAEERPGELPVLARRVLEDLPAGSELTRGVLPWLDVDDLLALADQAVAALARPGRPRDAAAAVVDGVSLQVPGALSRHLPALSELDEGAYFYSSLGSEAWWNGADLAELNRLAGLLTVGAEDERFRAWSCLLQSRTAQGWAVAWEHRDVVADMDPAMWEIFWWSVGVDASPAAGGGPATSAVGTGDPSGAPLRSLVTAPAYHLRIPPEALVSRPQPWRARWHPTWGLPGGGDLEPGRVVTGGLSEGECPDGHGPLRRLLLLEPPPPGCAADGRARLDLGYCFGCEIPAFYGHDADGRPHRLGQGTNDWQPSSFDAYDVRPAITVPVMHPLPRWQRQDWSLAHDRENLNRIGGEPTWIQDPDYPACPSCATPMPFLAQLDWSHLIDGEGITYILWCQPCAVSAILYQST